MVLKDLSGLFELIDWVLSKSGSPELLFRVKRKIRAIVFWMLISAEQSV
jgi:hypothetical protein